MPLRVRGLVGTPLTRGWLDANFAERVVQVSHGMSLGDLVRIGSAGSWVLAQADSISGIADGIVLATSGTDVLWVVTLNGVEVEWPGHGLGADGSLLWTSQTTPGSVVAGTEPYLSGVIQPVGKIKTVNSVLFRLGAVQEL